MIYDEDVSVRRRVFFCRDHGDGKPDDEGAGAEGETKQHRFESLLRIDARLLAGLPTARQAFKYAGMRACRHAAVKGFLSSTRPG